MVGCVECISECHGLVKYSLYTLVYVVTLYLGIAVGERFKVVCLIVLVLPLA